MGDLTLLLREWPVCFVASGEGADERQKALSLAASGRAVHFLWCDSVRDRAQFRGLCRGLDGAGVTVHRLEEVPVPAACRAPNGTPGCGIALYTSNVIRFAVEALHRSHRFGAVIFPCRNAAGFRCVQAKRAGTAFVDVTLAVRLDGISQLLRAAEKRWPAPDDLFLDHCERYTFENADIRLDVSAPMREQARRLGWAVAADLPADAFSDNGQGQDLPSASPVVTVAVSYYNLGRYLPETLASLAAQTYDDLEVLVIDDGSTCEESRRVFEEQRRLYPWFRFVRQPNAGLGAARNRALREARGEFFIPVDADNVAAPGMVETFVRAMRSDPGASALTCFFLAFRDFSDLAGSKFEYQCCPTGGPHLAACAYNVYGDANAVFRTADLRAVGGFVEDRATYCHDWETFVKLVRAGRLVGVVPEYLFYYRRRADGMAAVMTHGGTDQYPYVQRILTTFFTGEEPQANPESRILWEALAGSLLAHAAARPAPERLSLRRLLRGAFRRIAAVGRLLRPWTRRGPAAPQSEWPSARATTSSALPTTSYR